MAAYDSFIGSVLRPKNLYSLKDPYTYESIQVTLMGPEGPIQDPLEFPDLFPFQTLADLETAIYNAMDQNEKFHPQNLCLMQLLEDGSYRHLQAFHTRTTALGIQEEILLQDPLTQMMEDSIDLRFIDLNGTRHSNVNTILRYDYLLESVFLQPDQPDYEIHCFLYSDALAKFSGATQPIAPAEWAGRFQIYWPVYPKVQEDGSVSEEELEYAPQRVQRFLERTELLKELNRLLEEKQGEFRIPGVTMRTGDPGRLGSFKNLRLAWTPEPYSQDYEPFRVESVFYEMPVSEDVPYMRFWPRNQSPLSKVHVAGALNMPSLEKPEILLQWAGKKSKSITPDEDLLMIKIRLRSSIGSINPLYATLFIFEDASAKLVIQPNEDMKKVSRIADLQDLSDILDRVMKTIPNLQPRSGSGVPPLALFPESNLVLEDCYAVFDIFLEKEDSFVLSKDHVTKVLPYFLPVFQVTTSPIAEQNPIAFLRYKAMDNFRIPSRDFQFLWRVLDLQKLDPKDRVGTVKALKMYYQKEYNVSDAVANRRIAEFLATGFDFEKTAKATEVQIRMKNNPGVDIAMFGKAPYYFFHFYRINGLLTFQRLMTLISLFLTVTPEDFTPGLVAMTRRQRAVDTAEEEAANAEAIGSSAAGGPGPSGRLENAVAAAAAAREAEGNDEAAFAFNDGLGELELGNANAEEAATPPPPLAQLAREDEEDGEAVAEADVDDEEEIVDVKQLQSQPAYVYFRKRLYFYDKTLFNWEKTHPSAKKYPIRCQSAQMKQPAVMNEQEYTIMTDLYESDVKAGRVIFIEYPIPKGTKYPDLKGKAGVKPEIINILKYGSGYAQGDYRYFVCSLYWCRRDAIVVLKDDFEKGWDHTGDPAWKGPKRARKDPNTCPFCGGGLVQNTRKTLKGETVIERSFGKKKGVEKHHTFVGFLGKQRHPDGYYLPCCFLKDEKIFEDKHPAYKDFVVPPRRPPVGAPAHQAPIPAEPVAADLAEQEEEEDLAAVNEYLGAAPDDGRQQAATVDYASKLADIPSSYILGSEKIPLDVKRSVPEVGACSEPVERYFSQFPSIGTIRKHDHTVWKLMTNPDGQVNASGFFRIACENTSRFKAESFFAALAPYYGKRSASEIKSELVTFIQAPLFLMLNYGNFLFDFYNPGTPLPGRQAQATLLNFARKELKLPSGVGKHQQALARAWKGFQSFKAYMRSDTTVKEYRLFAQLLSLPGLLTWTDSDGVPRQNGILFIVLEVDKGGAVTVRCPPFGVTRDAAERCDVAFILKYHTGIWEPLFYTLNKPSEDLHKTMMVFAREEEESWPAIVKERVKEFIQMCHSSGLGVYTDTYSVKEPIESLLIPLSKAMDLATPPEEMEEISEEDQVVVHGILRDTYNHVSAVIYLKDDSYIVLPVIDDGSVYPATQIELDWKNLMTKLATAEDVRTFYTDHIYPLVDTLPNHRVRRNFYTITRQVRQDKTVPYNLLVYALKLGEEGGDYPNLYVPVKLLKEEAEAAQAAGWEPIQELPWMVDTQIVYGEQTASVAYQLDTKDTEEIYQHLRYTFANWLSVNPSVKEEIEEIIFDSEDGRLPNRKLTIWEKRDSLEVKFGEEVLSWMDDRLPQINRRPSLKRIDCTVQVQGTCDNRCVWKADENRCLLHIPEQKDTDGKRLFLRKLIEELIQFPVKRNDLLENRVYQYIRIRDRTQLGSQLFIPESVPAWAEFLRMEWRQQASDIPRTLEELRGIRPLAEGEEFTPAETESSPTPIAAEEEEGSPEASPEAEEEADEDEGSPEAEEEADEEEGEEAQAIPDVVQSVFGSIPGLEWWPEARLIQTRGYDTVFDLFQQVHSVDQEALAEKGQIAENSVYSTLQVLKEIAKASGQSIVQMEWEPENPAPPVPLIVRAQTSGSARYENVIIILKLPSDPYTVGILSISAESPDPVDYETVKAVPFLKKAFGKAPVVVLEV